MSNRKRERSRSSSSRRKKKKEKDYFSKLKKYAKKNNFKKFVRKCNQWILAEPPDEEIVELLHRCVSSESLTQYILQFDDIVDMIDGTDKRKSTSLMEACSLGNRDVIFLLLEKGADPKLTDCEGNNALHCALCSQTPCLEAIYALFNDYEVPANQPNHENETPIDLHLNEALADWEGVLEEEMQREIREAWVNEQRDLQRANAEWDRNFEERMIHEAETEGITGMDLFGANWARDEMQSINRQHKQQKHWTELIEEEFRQRKRAAQAWAKAQAQNEKKQEKPKLDPKSDFSWERTPKQPAEPEKPRELSLPEVEAAREAQDARWNAFMDRVKNKDTLRESDVPWPTKPVYIHISMTNSVKKKLFRKAFTRWHPDRFTQRFKKKFKENDWPGIYQRIESVCKDLNSLRESIEDK